MAIVANHWDTLDLKTRLFLANIQVVKWITEGLTFFWRLFLTSDDWKQCRKLLIPSQNLSIKELSIASVHINSTREICPGRPLVSLPLPSPKVDEFELAGKTTLNDKVDNNDGSQREDNPDHDGSGKKEDDLSNNDGRKTSGIADKQTQISDNKSKVDQTQPYHHIFSRASPPVISNKLSRLNVESKVRDLGNTSLEQAKCEMVILASVSRLDLL